MGSTNVQTLRIVSSDQVNQKTNTVIRVGNVVNVFEGSVNQALRSMGFNPEKFRSA